MTQLTAALFVANAERERRRQGLTYQQIATRASLSINTVYAALNRPGASRGVTLAVAAKIAGVLGVPMDRLLAEPKCLACHDQPPAGFTCNECGGTA